MHAYVKVKKYVYMCMYVPVCMYIFHCGKKRMMVAICSRGLSMSTLPFIRGCAGIRGEGKKSRQIASLCEFVCEWCQCLKIRCYK